MLKLWFYKRNAFTMETVGFKNKILFLYFWLKTRFFISGPEMLRTRMAVSNSPFVMRQKNKTKEKREKRENKTKEKRERERVNQV
jgi:hypothetical protein